MADVVPASATAQSAESMPPATGPWLELSPAQRAVRVEVRGFVRERISPFADQWDQEAALPLEVIDEVRRRRYLGTPLSSDLGGRGWGPITYGLLTAEIGRGCSSVRSLLTVHDMATMTLGRWGNASLKDLYLSELASGALLGALALSEPNVGSDAARAETVAREEEDAFVLNGRKKWITFGQIADLFLVLAQLDGKATAFLVPATAPGFHRDANEEVMGTRASLLAELRFEDCRVPKTHLLGRPGFGFTHVISYALDHGRYSVAWGAVGVAEACLDACQDYTSSRHQGGCLLREHQLVRRILTNMIADTRSARLLCYRAGHLRSQRDPSAAAETMLAKYVASKAATRCANDAVQLHGANGLTRRFPVARYLRDSRVLEIIEGSSQIQQITIPQLFLEEL